MGRLDPLHTVAGYEEQFACVLFIVPIPRNRAGGDDAHFGLRRIVRREELHFKHVDASNEPMPERIR
jgi:hypothetical protein